MKLLYSSGGYTILETMIFLIVSVAFVGSIVTTLTQQNRKTQFVQAVDGMQQKMQDILNDVSTGYYPSANNLNCTASSTGPVIAAGTNEQGTNDQCIFVGKAIQFAPSENGGAASYNVYTMVGNRKTAAVGGTEVTNITESKPKLVGVGDTTSMYDTFQLASGVEVAKVVGLDYTTGTHLSIGGIEIISDFSVASNGTVRGNSSRVSLARVLDSSLLTTRNNFATVATNPIKIDTANVRDGVVICLREGAVGRIASLTIGGNDQQLSITRTIDSWPTECN